MNHKFVNIRIREIQLEGIIILAVFTLFICFLTGNYFSNKSGGKYSIKYSKKGKGQVIAEIISFDTNVNGIYFLPEKAKVSDALMASGIANIGSYKKSFLDKTLSGGACIEIKTDMLLNIVEMNNAKKLILGIPVNINKLASKDLVLIPGIGEETAKEIVLFRRISGPFTNLEDLMKVKGIKEKKFESLKKHFCVGCK